MHVSTMQSLPANGVEAQKPGKLGLGKKSELLPLGLLKIERAPTKNSISPSSEIPVTAGLSCSVRSAVLCFGFFPSARAPTFMELRFREA